jgi:CheY-like chemotaxis protein
MDGVTLTPKVQDEFEIAPLILMMTAVGDDDSRQQTLQACADGDDDSRQQTLQACADEFLIKPYLLYRKQPSSMVNDCLSLGMIG